MTQRSTSVVAILFLGLLGCQGPQASKSSLNDVSLEVAALHAVYQFQLTPEQMRAVHKMARETAGEANGSRETPKASEAFRKAVTSLRDALVKADDDELIGKLVDEMESLREKEDPQLDDAIEVTDEARKRTPELLKLLSARQVMAYLTSLGDHVADPLASPLE